MNVRKGFTLIELLVVIAIIGILAAVVLASLNTAREKSRDASRIQTLKEVQKALELYYSENGNYPIYSGTWSGSSAGCYGGAGLGISELVSDGFLPRVPEDPRPSGSDCFIYQSSADGSIYKYMAHRTMEACTAGSCDLQDPVRSTQQTSSVYSEGGAAF